MTKERILESQDIRTVYDGAATRKSTDPFDWPWGFFVAVIYGAIGLCLWFLLGGHV